MSRLGARLAALSHDDVLRVARTGLVSAHDANVLAEQLLVTKAPLPTWARDEVLLAPDLIANIICNLQWRNDSAASAVCSTWNAAWYDHLARMQVLKSPNPVRLPASFFMLHKLDSSFSELADWRLLHVLPLSTGELVACCGYSSSLSRPCGAVINFSTSYDVVSTCMCHWPATATELPGGQLLIAECNTKNALRKVRVSDGVTIATVPMPGFSPTNGYFMCAVSGTRIFAITAGSDDFLDSGSVFAHNLEGLQFEFAFDAGREPKAIAAASSSEVIIADAAQGVRLFSSADGTHTRTLNLSPLLHRARVRPLLMAATAKRIFVVCSDERDDESDEESDYDDVADSHHYLVALSHAGELIQYFNLTDRFTQDEINIDDCGLGVSGDALMLSSFSHVTVPYLKFSFFSSIPRGSA